MFNTPEMFFDMWQILDNPQVFPFFKQNQTDDTIIIQNTLNPNVDNYIYISDKEPDFKKILGDIHNNTSVVSFYTKSKKNNENCFNKGRFINSSVIYQNTCHTFNSNLEFGECIVEKATTDDCNALPCDDDENVHDYIGQIRDAIIDDNGEVYVLKSSNSPVCFMILTDTLSKKFDKSCKCVSVVYTLTQHRKQGYAEMLIKNIMSKYKDKTFLYIADSDKNLASNSLALACGFKVIGYNHQVEINL